MDIARIRELVDRLAGSAAEEIRLRTDGVELLVRFAPGGGAAMPAAAPGQVEVRAEVPGIVYLAPAPGEAPFVTPGAQVQAGQVLLLVESMKSMLPLTAPVAGRVAEIRTGTDTACEAGAVLVVLDGAVA